MTERRDSDWTNAELARSVIALTEAIRTLNATIDGLDDKFVLRAVHDVEMANIRQVQRTQGDVLDRLEQTDIPAIHTRITKVKDSTVSRATVWQVVGLVVGLAGVAVAVLAIYHGSH